MATIWEAILVLDEAEVYLESRVVQDFQRNSLVSVFLRALEYYQGILFLTTNRVGTFDDGFLSRVHVVIHYPDFTPEQRSQIWDIFFNKLEAENKNFRVQYRTVEFAKQSAAMKELEWNGREIRNGMSSLHSTYYCSPYSAVENLSLECSNIEKLLNLCVAFNTAIALAEYDDKREEGKILVESRHLEQVAKMSRAFRNYMKDVHGMDTEKKAKGQKLRSEFSPSKLAG